MTKLHIGVVGAGRVGAVLAAGLSAAGHEVVAAAGESDASRGRIEALLPGVPVAKPTDVARACDLLLLTVPDDMLSNVVTMLSASGAIREGQVVVHTSGRHGLAVLEPAREVGARTVALHPAMTFTGTELDLPRLAGRVLGVTAGPRRDAPPAAVRRPRQRTRPRRRSPDGADRSRRRGDRSRARRGPRHQRSSDAAVLRHHGACHARPRGDRRAAASDPRAQDAAGPRRRRGAGGDAVRPAGPVTSSPVL